MNVGKIQRLSAEHEELKSFLNGCNCQAPKLQIEAIARDPKSLSALATTGIIIGIRKTIRARLIQITELIEQEVKGGN